MSLLSRGLGPGSLTKAPRPLPGRPCPAQGGPRQGEGKSYNGLGGPASPLMQPPTTWPGTPLAVGAPDSSPIPAVPTQPTPVLPRSDLKAHVPAPSLDPCQARVSGAGQRH